MTSSQTPVAGSEEPALRQNGAENHGIVYHKADVRAALDDIHACMAPVRAYFTDSLNQYHGTRHSFSYWNLVAGDWLLQFVHVVYVAFQEAGQGREVSLPGQEQVVARSVADFSRAVTEDRFNSCLRGRIVERLSGRQSGHVFSTADGAQDPGSLGARLKRGLVRSVLGGIGARNAPLMFSNAYFKCTRGEWISTLVKWRRWARQDNLSFPVAIPSHVDHSWRHKNAHAVEGNSLAATVMALMPLYMPIVCLEGFRAFRSQGHQLGIRRPRALFTATGLHGPMLFKVLAADWREEGTHVLNHQHGGGYGIDPYQLSEDYETQVSDHFYTLGWHGHEGRATPLPGAISAFPRPVSGADGKILLNCVCYPRFAFRVHYRPMPGTIETLIDETAKFVCLLRLSRRLTIRPYPLDFGWRFMDTILQADPEIAIDDARISGPASYAQSALVIHNYLGSSWLETLAMDIPTVCFYDANVYDFNDNARPFIERFEASGVLHRSAAEAARFVSSIMSDPQAWWQTPAVQDARREFVGRFANYSPDWAPRWEAELRRWVD